MWKIRQKWRRIWLPLVLIVSIVIAYILVKYFSCDISQIIVYAGGFIAGMVALSTYLKNSSIKRMEFIDRIYEIFDKDEGITNLHNLLTEDKDLKIPFKSPHEPALIKALTLFDTILNYYEQNLINDETLSYIAAEILDFSNLSGVKDYVKDIHKKYKYEEKKYIRDIWPYSGLDELGKICSKKFSMKKSEKHQPCND
jgi:hypothetical protein